jgi:cell division septation protein DedD
MRNAILCIGVVALSACADAQLPGFLQPDSDGASVSRAATGGGAAVTERDIEAPEIFEATEAGLWDGRPSLGGVWVAHPEVPDPERVIIRNESNGEFVIGALFRREREAPGPRLQVSSDAAAALGMLAGAPTNLNVEDAATGTDGARDTPVEQGAEFSPAPEVSAGALPADAPVSDPAGSGAAEPIETAAVPPDPAPTAEPEPQRAATASPASALSRPFVQIGIFSVEQNARNTATAMRQAGMVPTVKKQTARGKTFWRVVVGPATTASERDALLETIRGTGFSDAYAVDG